MSRILVTGITSPLGQAVGRKLQAEGHRVVGTLRSSRISAAGLPADELVALDLENNWAVVAEGIQTVLRREGYEAPYEALKNLTRGKDRIEESDIHAFIDVLEVSDAIKAELKNIRPENYTGIDLMSDHE